MTVKAGKIITTARGFLVDRLQTVGPSNLTLPSEKIHEVGNELAVATVYDTPTLTWDAESYDVTTEMEALILGLDPTTVADGQKLDFFDAKPLDIASPYKGPGSSKTSVAGVGIPYLTLENVSYRFGVGQNATQSFSLTGDSIYYMPGITPYTETFTGGAAGEEYEFANAAEKTVEKGQSIYALSVTVVHDDGSYERQFHGENYTDSATGFTLLQATTATDEIHVLYGSLVPATFAQSVHPTPSVKPAALRGKDIELYIALATGVGQTLVRWRGVQSVEVSRRVTLENDDELGNAHHVDSSYDVPEVSGSLTMRPGSVDYLFDRIAQITNTAAGDIANLLSTQPLEMQIRLNHPETGARLKTLRVPDARIEPAALQGRVQQRLEPSFPFTSDSGLLEVFKGAPA